MAGFEPVVSECLLETHQHCVGGVINLAVGVKNTVEWAGGHQFGVELLEGARSSIAWVDKGRFTRLVTLFVQSGKGFVGHEDLTANLKEGGGSSEEGAAGWT